MLRKPTTSSNQEWPSFSHIEGRKLLVVDWLSAESTRFL